MEFRRGEDGGAPKISVTAHVQAHWVEPPERGACAANAEVLLPPVQTYRMEFRFDGRRYQPDTASADAVRMFVAR